MQTIPQPKKNAATFRIKKARRIEIKLTKEILKNLKALEPNAESQIKSLSATRHTQKTTG